MTIDEVLFEAEEKMEHAVEFLRTEFRGIRTGRASAGLVDHIKVDYYDTPTDLRQLASIATPDATLIVIKPFDPTSIKEIEKAIFASDLGITPSNDGKMIRLGDVADTALAFERTKSVRKVNGHEAVMISVVKNSSTMLLIFRFRSMT